MPLRPPSPDGRLPVQTEAEERRARALLASQRGRPAISPAPAVSIILRKVVPVEPRADGPSLKELTRRWPEVVGPMIAAHTRPERRVRSAEGDTLVLRVSPAAGPMVQMQTKALLERINLYAGGARFTRLVLDSAPLPRATRTAATPTYVLDAADEADLEDRVSGVDHDGLRRALLDLGRAILTRDGSSKN